MFIFINPWASYDKEDLEAINEIITENSGTIVPWLMLIINIVTIGLWLWICNNEILFSIVVPSLCILTFIVGIFDIIYIIDLWKEKKKHLEN